jgi:hypothetical protein
MGSARTSGLVIEEVMLLRKRSTRALERGHNVNDLGLSLNGLEVFMGFSVNPFDIEQGHVTYLCPRTILGLINKFGEMRSARDEAVLKAYQGFLHGIDGLLEGITRRRQSVGGWTSLVVHNHLITSGVGMRELVRAAATRDKIRKTNLICPALGGLVWRSFTVRS